MTTVHRQWTSPTLTMNENQTFVRARRATMTHKFYKQPKVILVDYIIYIIKNIFSTESKPELNGDGSKLDNSGDSLGSVHRFTTVSN